ncbi:hypothetical protein [Rhizobium phage RHph_X3_9]|nr:hypothetical protein [Rhizobium phage RHph_X3_9]
MDQQNFEQVMPTAGEAKGWHNLNRKHRRAAMAKARASRYDEDGNMVRRSLRKHTEAVQYARGVQQNGV